MRHVDRRHAQIVLESADLSAHLDAQLCVEIRKRFVHQECLRLTNDRAPHRDSLALPAGKSPRLALEELLETENVCGLLDAFIDLCLRHLLHAQAESDVVVDREVRIESVALEDHCNVAVAGWHVIDHPLTNSH